MATLTQSLRLRDEMSATLMRINASLERVTTSFANMQDMAGNAVPEAAYNRINQDLDAMQTNLQAATAQATNLGRSFQNAHAPANSLLGTVKRIALTLGGIQTIKSIVGLSDEMAQTTARLNLMNDGLQTTRQLHEMIFQSAQRSRGSYLQMADAVAKMGIRAGSIFKSNAETVAFVEQLNKQFVIAGASQEEVASATLQLTQSLGSGVLRGEEFNAVFEAAPSIMQTLADYMGVPIGALRDYAEEGELSAVLVKNALLAATDEVNEKFNSMPLTWGQVWGAIKNEAVMAFQPVLDKINEVANGERFQTFAQNVTSALHQLGEAAADVFDGMIDTVNWAADNWDSLCPIIWLVVDALIAWKVAQWAVNIATYAFPVFWIAGVIALLIALIAKWVQSVGGVRMAWLILKDDVLSAMDTMSIGMQRWVAFILIGWDAIVLGFKTAGVAIKGVALTIRVGFLTIIQGMVNQSIDLLNGFITILNTVTGKDLQLGAHVTFADAAARDAQREMAMEQAGLMGTKAAMQENMVGRIVGVEQAQIDANFRHFERMNEIGWLRYDLSQQDGGAPNLLNYQYGDPFDPDMLGAAKDTAANTGRMADAMEISEEDLKYLRDIAERETINRFTTAEIKLDMTNYNTVNGDQDLDGLVDTLGVKLYEMMAMSAEGRHD